MRLLFLLLFCTQSFVSTFASINYPDISSRGASMARYTVIPVKPSNATDTESMLKSMFGNVNIVTSRSHDEITSWTITSSDNELIASTIRTLEGVQDVERQELVSRAEAVSADFGHYVVKPKEDADDEKTDEFLKSKIQANTHMVTIMQPDGHITVWFNVVLSHEAKQEVEKYEGIEELIPLAGMATNEASMATDRPQSETKRSGIMRRDTQIYEVLAADDTNVTTTEEFLRSKVKNPDRILYHSWGDEPPHGWYNLELDPEAKKEVEAYKGIKAIRGREELEDFTAPAKDIPPSEPEHTELTTRDIKWYTVMATNDSDVKKTEDFLKSKVQSGTEIFQHSWGGVVSGWFNAALDADAKKEVEGHEGVKRIKMMREFEFFDQPSIEKESQPEPEHKELLRRDVEIYMALANTSVDTSKTEAFLESKVQQNIRSLYPLKDENDAVVGWVHLALDAAAKEEVQNHEGIRDIQVGKKLVDFRALSTRGWMPSKRHITHETIERDHALHPRAEKWAKQRKADKALVMDSQYNGANLDTLTDFVHVQEPGKGSFVYHMCRGVNLGAVNLQLEEEFHPPNGQPTHMQVLQTKSSKDMGQDPYVDDSNGHDTPVAARAVGSQFGLAKSATIIPVKMIAEAVDFRPAFELILEDLKTHPERAHRSVILISSGTEDPSTLKDAKANMYEQQTFENPIKRLLDRGVPIVCAAGNYADNPNRQNIDTQPALYQAEDTPIINVGAASFAGERYTKSQAGSQLTLYAPGVEIEYGEFDVGKRLLTGTSMAAPQVAGLIATYLSYDTKPWDDNKQGVERVKAIRDYLVSDQSSWERKPGIRMIWNGAGENEHKGANANGFYNPFRPPLPTSIPTSPKPTSSPTPSTPQPAQASKALSVILQRTLIGERGPWVTSPNYENKWLFYETDRGVPPGCKPEKDSRANQKAGDDGKMIMNAPWPSITQPLHIDGMDCQYMSNGQNPGALWCNGRNGAITCYEENAKKEEQPTYCVNGSGEMARRPTAYCEW